MVKWKSFSWKCFLEYCELNKKNGFSCCRRKHLQTFHFLLMYHLHRSHMCSHVRWHELNIDMCGIIIQIELWQFCDMNHPQLIFFVSKHRGRVQRGGECMPRVQGRVHTMTWRVRIYSDAAASSVSCWPGTVATRFLPLRSLLASLSSSFLSVRFYYDVII